MRRLALLLVCGCGLFFTAPALAGTTYTNSPGWDGSNSIFPWGVNPSSTSTYGQTIPGNGQRLTSFTFHMDVNEHIVFEGAVATWNGSRAGSILWRSADRTTGGANGSYTAVTFDIPGGVQLQSGQQYVIFATSVFSTQPGTITPNDAKWGGVPEGGTDSFPGGTFVYFNTGSPGALTSQNWDGGGGYGYDAAFTAVFNTSAAGIHESRIMVCLSSDAPRADGTTGRFFQLAAATWAAGVNDPASPFYQSKPAVYVEGYGAMCQLSDVVTYGGDPAGYSDAGYRVAETGEPTPAAYSPADWGAVYEYYARR